MPPVHKILDIAVTDRRKDGGRIVITTGNPDREHDRVFPQGAKLENYLKNPVVLWGHDYFSAASLIGKTKTIEVTETGIVADFDLRPAANEADPQNIVLLLWEQEFVRTSSIGFQPIAMMPNDMGGMDFTGWELLEFSLCSVPMNPEALRLAAKSYPKAFEAYQKAGRVLSASNEKKLTGARDAISEVLDQLSTEESDDGKSFQRRSKSLDVSGASAWVRRMEAVSDLGTQQLYAVFRQYMIDVPKDATTLRCDDEGNIIEVPDPNAGKSVTRKEVVFVPPIAYEDEDWGDDATYSISASDREDAEMVKGMGGEWEVTYLGEVLDQIPLAKSAKGASRRRTLSLGLAALTQRGYERAKAMIRRKALAVRPTDIDLSDDDLAALKTELAAMNTRHAARR